MNITLNNTCMALLCSAIMIATPAMAQFGDAVDGTVAGTLGSTAGNAGAGRTGINGTVPAPSATGTINRSAMAAVNTINAGAGTTNNASDSMAAAMNNKSQANAGASVSPGVSASGNVNSTDIANNAASVDRSTQISAGKMTRQANAVNVKGSANTPVQQ